MQRRRQYLAESACALVLGRLWEVEFHHVDLDSCRQSLIGDTNVRIDHAVISGCFSLDGGTWEVENNLWVLGDDASCVVIDAPHDAEPIVGLIGSRELTAVLCTHAHNDHITVAVELARRYGAQVRLHPADEVLWRLAYPEERFAPLADGESIAVAGTRLGVIHTPGHSPGASCFYLPDAGVLFSGDTLFKGGPGATGRSFSSFETIIGSLRDRVLTLPVATTVLTGHGDPTTIEAESADLADWIKRGY